MVAQRLTVPWMESIGVASKGAILMDDIANRVCDELWVSRAQMLRFHGTLQRKRVRVIDLMYPSLRGAMLYFFDPSLGNYTTLNSHLNHWRKSKPGVEFSIWETRGQDESVLINEPPHG